MLMSTSTARMTMTNCLRRNSNDFCKFQCRTIKGKKSDQEGVPSHVIIVHANKDSFLFLREFHIRFNFWYPSEGGTHNNLFLDGLTHKHITIHLIAEILENETEVIIANLSWAIVERRVSCEDRLLLLLYLRIRIVFSEMMEESHLVIIVDMVMLWGRNGHR